MGLRVVFMGTPDFGVPVLQALGGSHHTMVGVITQPDKPALRGRKIQISPVKQTALELKTKIWQPEKVNAPDFLEHLRAQNIDIAVVAAFGQILGQSLLTLPRFGCINLHGSLLPKLRGAAPIQWAIAEGFSETGLTVQRMVRAVDAGAVLTQKAFAIGPEERALELFARLSAAGGGLILAALDILEADPETPGTPQIESEATFAPRLTRDDGKINWDWPAEKICNRVRAFNPWPGTFSECAGTLVKILAARTSSLNAPMGVAPGTILACDDKQGWWVAAGRGTTLTILEVQCANSRVMDAQSFTCGYRIGKGDRLGEKVQA
jgi:methionyl-tRNA formyltransferase